MYMFIQENIEMYQERYLFSIGHFLSIFFSLGIQEEILILNEVFLLN